MNFIWKLWLTLVVLFPVSLGILWLDDGDSALTTLAVAEMLSLIAVTVGATIVWIWSK